MAKEFFSELFSNLMSRRKSFVCHFSYLIFISLHFTNGFLWCFTEERLRHGLLDDSERKMADTAAVLVLKNLKRMSDLNSCVLRNQIGSFQGIFLISFFLIGIFLGLEKKLHENVEVKDLGTQVTGLDHEAEYIIEFLVVRFVVQKRSMYCDIHCPLLRGVIEGIKYTMKKVSEIKLYGTVPQIGMSSHIGGSSRGVKEETVVGFDHEAEIIKEQLTGVSKQLQVISIVGMAGLGKTTLARKVYNDFYVVHHFYIRGWTYVSQQYRKRDLLVGILSCIVEHKYEICTMSDEKLGEELSRRLKGQRYLIIMDDMWHIEVWNDLKRYFPNDNNGSRVMFTSRITEVALHAKPGGPLHFLRFLTEDESWELLKQKIFRTEVCPPVLEKLGKQIVKKCQGLPLAIVIVAGLLAKTNKMQDWWKQVAQSISSHSISDTKQCLKTLALSYSHLPNHLKTCFLYFGAFMEDCEIRVWKLIRLGSLRDLYIKLGKRAWRM